MSVVAVTRVRESVKKAVAEAMELASWKDAVPAGASVAIKPNLCWDLPLPGAQTSPWVFEAVVDVIKDRVSDIVVIEANQITVNADKALLRTGIGKVVERHGLPFVNMSKGTFRKVTLQDAFIINETELPEILFDRVLITVPVLKTHGTTIITGALKNQWGCLKELRHNFHLVVDEAIADLNDYLRPAFAIMDGTVGMEGNGPKTGIPKVADLVLASSDLVALDTIAATVMGFSPAKIPHLSLSEKRGLGTADRNKIEIRGIDISGMNLGFKPPRQNFMVKMEFALRHSRLKRLAFETPFLGFLGYGARIWNGLWYAMVGKKYRAKIMNETRYGAQWKGIFE